MLYNSANHKKRNNNINAMFQIPRALYIQYIIRFTSLHYERTFHLVHNSQGLHEAKTPLSEIFSVLSASLEDSFPFFSFGKNLSFMMSNLELAYIYFNALNYLSLDLYNAVWLITLIIQFQVQF